MKQKLSFNKFMALGALAAFVVMPSAYAAAPAMPPKDIASVKGIAPHRAVYDVRMVSSKNGSQIINIAGQMSFEWKPSCEGWLTHHHFDLRYDYAEQPSMTISSDFSTFEGFDGKTLDFTSRRKKNGAVYEELRGNAKLDGQGGASRYSIPDGLTFDLTAGTLLPMGHTLNMLDYARGGKKFFHAQIFDGSDQEGPVEVNAVIGAKQALTDSAEGAKVSAVRRPAASKKIDAKLISTSAWPVRMAFFPSDKGEVQSDYEMTMLFHDNGIISDMKIDYADFSVRQKLVKLEKLKPDSCGE